MALYAVTCLDKPGSLELRLANRPDHLAYAQTSGKVRLAGPFLDADEKPCGSRPARWRRPKASPPPIPMPRPAFFPR